MRLNALALASGFALLVAGCGTRPPGNATTLRQIVGTDLIGARGMTRKDQGKIDATIEGLREAGVYSQADVERHQVEKSGR